PPPETDGTGGAPATHAGAALAVLEAAVTAAPAHAGAWAERLALAGAAAALGRLGRPEDEAALRDLIALGPDPTVGPAAPVAHAYLWLASGPVGTRWADLPDLVAGLGARTGDAPAALAAALTAAAALSCPLAAAATAGRAAVALRPGRAALALWAADTALARWLDWPYGLPLVTLGLPPGAPAPGSADAEHRLAAAVLRGSARALDQLALLGRRAAALQAVRPRLRARPADRVVDRLLARDALSVAGVRALIPERAARRLFERLVALGVLRELTGRTTSRLYGL
ncbi:MAG TPA: DUF1403 family protein, partial [Azospirillum sp.]|nr:DUF1403 family protein [Azospirillum sp.]